jgi:hypothetical protein
MSILYGVFSGLIKYWTNTVLDINELILSSVIFFVFLYLIAIIEPYVGRLLGYKNKE